MINKTERCPERLCDLPKVTQELKTRTKLFFHCLPRAAVAHFKWSSGRQGTMGEEWNQCGKWKQCWGAEQCSCALFP